MEKVLENTTVQQIVGEEKKIITLNTKNTLQEAIKTLSDAKILSAPVVDYEDQSNCIGFIDMFDILAYVLLMYTEDKLTVDGTQLHLWCQNIQMLEYRGKVFADHPISDVVDMSKKDPFCTIKLSSQLPPLLYAFNKGLHRAAVVDDGGHIVNMISQSDIVQFLAKNIDKLGTIVQHVVDDIGFNNKTIATIPSESRAIHAFHLMTTNHISAMAIVNKRGELVGNISISDLRGLSQENFPDLLLPCLEFIERKQNQGVFPLTVQGSTTFEDVIKKLASARVHRLWIVNEYNIPTGIISLTDVMRLLDLRVYIDQTNVVWEQEVECK